MSGFRVEGDSGNIAEVDADGNLNVTMPQDTGKAGFSIILCENDDGELSGTPLRRGPTVSVDKRLAVGLDTPLFDQTFQATAQDTGSWRYQFTTMTSTQGGGFLLMNSGDIGTATTGCVIQSWRYFSLLNDGGLRVSFVGAVTNVFPANQVLLMGLFLGTTPTVDPVEGVYFQYTNAGLIGAVNYNGVPTYTGVLDSSLITANNTVEFELRIYSAAVEFWIEGHYLGSITTPAGNPTTFMFTALPASVQLMNTGTVTGPEQFKLGRVSVTQRDIALNIPFEHQQAAMGSMGYQGQQGNTMGSTALYTNSLAPGAGAVMTNTTAALGSGLGGQFSALPTLAANTDGVLCSYQVPTGTVNIKPRTLMIRGVKVQGCVTTVLAGNATPVIYALALAYGHTTVSAATAEGGSFTTATTKSTRRVPLGYETYAAAAALGTLGSPSGVYMPFNAPIAVNPGEFVAVLAKNVGVVTTTGVITFLVAFDSYWI
jgi:hypothetical protein